MKQKAVYTLAALMLACLLLGAVILLIPFLPRICDWYLSERAPSVAVYRREILLILYPALAVAGVAMGIMLRLLFLVRSGKVFSCSTLNAVTAVSVCALSEAILFFLLGLISPFSYCIGGAALFLCVVLLLLRCVLAEATEIKAENDYTV